MTNFTADERKYIVDLARRSLVACVEKEQILSICVEDVPEKLRHIGACFVTYHKYKELRGCIGSILPSQPLYLEVIERAIQSALHDSRFSPITIDELPDIELEVSVLSIPQDIPTYSGFIPGEHGIILNKNGRRAVFLPQVAPEQGWDRETTLQHLSMKAGLSPNAWQSGAKFQIFTAEVFS